MKENARPRPSNFKNLIGHRFGKLVVVDIAGANKKCELKWLCKCDCGGKAIVLTSNLNRGNTTSCGCVAIESRKKRNKERHDEAMKRNEIKRIQREKEKKEKALNRFVDRFNEKYGKSFEYIGGYEHGNNKAIITIRCRECGTIKEKCYSKVFQSNIACQQCGNNNKGIKTSICVECGKEFKQYSIRQTMCKDCKKELDKAKGKAHARLREARAKENGKIDYSITLTRLMERDNCTCKICGRKVNENDYTYINDTFIAGNDYPSIDHIKPLSKGGVHQWDNVQLAHRICNSFKGNKED